VFQNGRVIAMLQGLEITAPFGESSIVGQNSDDCSHVGRRDLVFASRKKKMLRSFRPVPMFFTVTGEAASLAATAT
jgi:hypothetical protein